MIRKITLTILLSAVACTTAFAFAVGVIAKISALTVMVLVSLPSVEMFEPITSSEVRLPVIDSSLRWLWALRHRHLVTVAVHNAARVICRFAGTVGCVAIDRRRDLWGRVAVLIDRCRHGFSLLKNS